MSAWLQTYSFHLARQSAFFVFFSLSCDNSHIDTNTIRFTTVFSLLLLLVFHSLSRVDLLAYVSLSLSAFIQRFVYLYSSLVLISIFAWCFLVLLLLLCAAHKFSGRRCVCATHKYERFTLFSYFSIAGLLLILPNFCFLRLFFFLNRCEAGGFMMPLYAHALALIYMFRMAREQCMNELNRLLTIIHMPFKSVR